MKTEPTLPPSASASRSSRTSLSRDQVLRASTLAFAVEALRLPEGKWDFENRPWQVQPLIDPAEHQVWEKATQVGCTVIAFAKGAQGLCYEFPLGVGMFMPSEGEMRRFAKTKLARMIRGSRLLKPMDVNVEGKEADNTQIKAMGKSYLYLVGLKTEAGVRAFSIDMAVIDEVDAIAPQMRKLVLDRMGNSTFKRTIELSRPTFPEYGIDERFLESDQHYWMVKCEGCNRSGVLEEDWPENVAEKDKQVFLMCPSCKKPIDLRNGDWVNKALINNLRGYHFSQLLNPNTDLTEMLEDFKSGKYPDIFKRSRLGLPSRPKEGGLSRQDIFALCARSPFLLRSNRGGITMGIDVGAVLHVVASCPGPMGTRLKRLYKRSWDDVDRLIKELNPWRVTIDAMPELEMSKKLAARWPGKVFRCWYDDNVTGDPVIDQVTCEIKANRTMSLDVATDNILKKRILIQPKDEAVEEFAAHAVKLVKIAVEDKKNNVRFIWDGKPDHYRHADNYDTISSMAGNQIRVRWL